MMGRQGEDQAKLFYEFCLEDRVPAEHLLRKIDRFLDLSTLRQGLTSFYSRIGRPSIDPELMIRMLVVGYCSAIRSERRLVGGEGFAVDASLVAADANKQRSFASADEVDWRELATTRRSVREYLDRLDEAAWGAASEVVPKFISPSDPAAQWTGAHKGHAFFAYADNYLIDLKAAIIVDVEATRASRRARGGSGQEHARPHGDLLRLEATAAQRGQRIRIGRDPRLVIGRKEDRAAGAGMGQKARAPTEPSAAPTSSSTPSRTPIPARAAKSCRSITARSRDPGPASRKTTQGSTEPDKRTVRSALSKPDAARDSRTARCREACMRLRATR